MATGVRRVVPCDIVVFTGDWIPDHELARLRGVDIDDGHRGPVVDTSLRTSAGRLRGRQPPPPRRHRRRRRPRRTVRGDAGPALPGRRPVLLGRDQAHGAGALRLGEPWDHHLAGGGPARVRGCCCGRMSSGRLRWWRCARAQPSSRAAGCRGRSHRAGSSGCRGPCSGRPARTAATSSSRWAESRRAESCWAESCWAESRWADFWPWLIREPEEMLAVEAGDH